MCKVAGGGFCVGVVLACLPVLAWVVSGSRAPEGTRAASKAALTPALPPTPPNRAYGDKEYHPGGEWGPSVNLKIRLGWWKATEKVSAGLPIDVAVRPTPCHTTPLLTSHHIPPHPLPSHTITMLLILGRVRGVGLMLGRVRGVACRLMMSR